MAAYFEEKTLLRPPANRAAFSDRAAYVMAEMSKLAYFKFEGGHTVDQFLESARSVVGDGKRLAKIKVLANTFIASTSPSEARQAFEAILNQHGFDLVETFNNGGTQAFLCKHKTHNTAILAFRGTETTEYADIRSDIQASLKEVEISGHTVLVHSGYWKAFSLVRGSIEEQLKKCEDCQLFITGHSLGGALATVAVKSFSSDASGACYTFGAPPVGTKDFENNLKTPLYRIMNHLDIVPNLPNVVIAVVMQCIYTVIAWILSYLRIDKLLSPGLRSKVEQLIRDASSYRQIGYGSYLTGTEEQPVLRYHLGALETGKMWLRALNPANLSKKRKLKRFLTDHAIEAYSTKLRHWAVSRQQ